MPSPLLTIKFKGLIRNQKWKEITGPEFLNALQECGWKEGTRTHFFRELRKDGPTCGIKTPSDLEAAIRKGHSVRAEKGKTVHWIRNGTAYIVYNAKSRKLITFSPGKERFGDPLGK